MGNVTLVTYANRYMFNGLSGLTQTLNPSGRCTLHVKISHISKVNFTKSSSRRFRTYLRQVDLNYFNLVFTHLDAHRTAMQKISKSSSVSNLSPRIQLTLIAIQMKSLFDCEPTASVCYLTQHNTSCSDSLIVSSCEWIISHWDCLCSSQPPNIKCLKFNN